MSALFPRLLAQRSHGTKLCPSDFYKTVKLQNKRESEYPNGLARCNRIPDFQGGRGKTRFAALSGQIKQCNQQKISFDVDNRSAGRCDFIGFLPNWIFP